MKFCVNARFIFQVKDNQNSFFVKAVSIFLLVTLIYIIFFFLLILGCSDRGKYGENCSMSCPSNCLKSRCDITKGTCFECIAGYLGPTCESNTIIAIQLFFLKLLMLLWLLQTYDVKEMDRRSSYIAYYWIDYAFPFLCTSYFSWRILLCIKNCWWEHLTIKQTKVCLII